MNNNGNANNNTASNARGVRPDFSPAKENCRQKPGWWGEKGGEFLPIMVNTKRDAASYESNDRCKREILCDANALYEAHKKASAGSAWKPQTQNFEMNLLFELSHMQYDLLHDSYQFKPLSEFVMHERGKTRVIHGEQIPDRVVKHVLCDEILGPPVQRKLIFDNGASLKGKGIDFTRRRLLYHLRRYYLENGRSNNGWILLMDFRKYYDNIRHDVLMERFRECIDDEYILNLLQEIINRSCVDVSYMDDEEFAHCVDIPFNSLEYLKIPSEKLTGEKYMAKHMNIGDQLAQVAGILYPLPFDNYIKIVRGVKFYARYMDDSYIIHSDRDYLRGLLRDATDVAREIGICVNEGKTRICKLSDYWRFLQIQYSLTETGRIIQKVHPKRLTVMRRKMRKLAPVMTRKEFSDWYRSWFHSHYKYMSRKQRENMDAVFAETGKECRKNERRGIV